MGRLSAFLLLFLSGAALASDVHEASVVERDLGAMATTTFTAQRRASAEPGAVRAWRDGRDVRKVEVVDADGDRKAVTRYYYGEAGRLVAWGEGPGTGASAVGDPTRSPEAAERLSAAAFYRDAARLAFEKKARSEQRSLCGEAETAVFACRVGVKLASVCVSKDAARDRGTLRLRVGIAGSRLPDEISVPSRGGLPSEAARGENVAFSGGGGSWLRLREGDTAYVAYSGIGRWGPHGETREKQGIVVERGGRPAGHLRCTERYETLPDTDWFAAMGITPDGPFDWPD